MTNKLDESVQKSFLYGTNPLQNDVGLIDAKEPRQGGQPQVREAAIQYRDRQSAAGEVGMGERQRR
ncbi:MAG: hypothetical protein ACKPKO_58120, partial [Candidatus Fonsibacter sp.]